MSAPGQGTRTVARGPWSVSEGHSGAHVHSGQGGMKVGPVRSTRAVPAEPVVEKGQASRQDPESEGQPR